MWRQLKWFDAILPLGLAVLLTPFFVASRLPGRPNYYVIVGLALLLSYVVLRWETIARVVGRRQLRHGGNAVALSLVMLGILVVANWILNRHVNRWDLTKERRYGLSDQTKKILANLKDDVHLVYFEDLQGPGAEEERNEAKDRLREYQAYSSHFKVEFNDPLKDPAQAVRYGLTAGTKLVIERGSKQERVNAVSEQELTNALIRVTRDKKRKICFVTGEGEPSLDDSEPAGYAGARQALQGGSYDVDTASLLGEADLNATCDALVLAGPKVDLPPQNVERLREYMKKGGKALILLEPEFRAPMPDFAALLKGWNIEIAPDVLIEMVRLPWGQPAATVEFGTRRLSPHEITNDMKGLAVSFRTVRSVQPGTGTVEGVNVQKFLETSANAWAETDLTLKKPDRDKGRPGPLAFGVAATIKAQASTPAPAASPAPPPSAGEKPAEAEARLVVVGDADFASNALLASPGNEDLFLNIVAWLVKDTDLISIRPKEAGDQRLNLMPRSGDFWLVAAIAVIILPGAFVIWGIVVWWRRR